jgi:hypothetical protein
MNPEHSEREKLVEELAYLSEVASDMEVTSLVRGDTLNVAEVAGRAASAILRVGEELEEAKVENKRVTPLWQQASRVAGYYQPKVAPTDFVQVVNYDLWQLDRAAHEVPPPDDIQAAEARATAAEAERDNLRREAVNYRDLANTYRRKSEAAEAQNEAMRKALERIRDATPRSTNSATADQFQSWVCAVAETALSPEGEGKSSSSSTEHSLACGSVDASTPSPAGWRTIDSAPPYRVPVLLIGRYPTGTSWSDIYHGWRNAGGSNWERWPHDFRPSHWMPLPQPPAEGE